LTAKFRASLRVRQFTYWGQSSVLLLPQIRIVKWSGSGVGGSSRASTPVSNYAYLDTSDSITTITSTGNSTYSTIDSIGDRLATSVNGTLGWIVPDLHGDVAAAVGAGATFVNAFRFDPYGETVATWTASSGSVNLPWRYQGRMLESADSSTSSDLYDFQARSYDPSLGTFSSFDSVSGTAQNPLSLNRYLYAGADPETLVDPDGHWPWDNVSIPNPVDAVTSVASATVNQVTSTVSNVGSVAVSVAANTAVTAAAVGLAAATHNPVGATIAIAAGTAAGAVSAAATDVYSGKGLDFKDIATGAVAGATYGAVFAATDSTTLSGAASGAAGNAFSQGWDYVASGGKSGFDWSQVGASAVVGGATGWAAGRLFGGKSAEDNAKTPVGDDKYVNSASGPDPNAKSPVSDDRDGFFTGSNKSGQPGSRGTWRVSTENNALARAMGPDGRPSCAICGETMEINARADYNLDHQPPWSHRSWPENTPRSTVLDDYQTGVRVTHPICNRLLGCGPTRR
jgi:RHS repeat-associated protein